ncbi:MAG: proline racemase [Anaerolineales bacterium]|nr:proline racemase [Anaerolineales bacterium]
MGVSKYISTIDSHTAGEGTRLVMSGLPPIPGKTMSEKLAYAEEHLSWVPGLLLLEPRGHKDLFGAILVPQCSPAADIGVLFMDNKGYEPMCGHAVIGIVTTLLETGMFETVEPETLVTLDTPSGLIRAHAQIMDGRVQAVSFENVPSFVYRSEVTLEVPEVGDLVVDVVFGGLFFVLVNAHQLEIELLPDQAARLADLGMRILVAANEQVPVRHPELPHINKIIDLRFYVEPDSDGADSRNVVILGDHMVDRSPCGTGTCAEVALRYARGQLGLEEPFVTESIIGTRFTGQVTAETQVGSGSEVFPAVIPKVTGSAYITGLHQFVLDGDDPFPEGFRLKA